MSIQRGLRIVLVVVVVGLSITACQGNQEGLKQFWSAGTGTLSSVPLLIALGVSFLICEVINAGMRRAMCDKRTFDVTVWLSYPVCIGPPFVGMLVSRYLLSWLDMAGPIYFIFLTTVITVPLCIVGTRWVIDYGKRHGDELSKMP